MTHATRSSFAQRLTRLLEDRLLPPGAAIDPATPLFVPGRIDSIRVLELIAWVERETGRTIPDHEIRMDNFHTVARIAEVFGDH